MRRGLEIVIDEFKHSLNNNKNVKLTKYLARVEKYACDEKEKAHLLGLLIRSNSISEDLKEQSLKKWLNIMRAEGLQDYYSGHNRPESNRIEAIALILFIGGLLVIIAGIIQLYDGNVRIGLGTKYLMFVIREGGTKILLGLLLVVGGIFRLRHEISKKRFIRELAQERRECA